MIAGRKKVALVTGGGRGLGADLAKRLAREGYAVAIHYCSSEGGAIETQKEIRLIGGSAEIVSADLAQPEESVKMVTQAVQLLGGGLDLVINNSGVYEPKSLEEMTGEDWLTGFHSTATAACFVIKASLPWLRQSGQGRVINIGDSSADRATARDLALGYHVGKTGVWMLTRSFAKAEASHGITVNMVSPGYLANSVLVAENEEIPAGRVGTFADIWAAVRFLKAEESSYINGTNIMVSGGWNLR